MQNTQKPFFPFYAEWRLKEVYPYNIPDTYPGKDIDGLVDVVSQLYGCPIAAINFVEKKQWLKARKGGKPFQAMRGIAFCFDTILSNEPLVVQDATKVLRFANHPFVTGGSNIRFYGREPVSSVQKKKFGAVCIIDERTGPVTVLSSPP